MAYDVIIVGNGPAGLSAALYTSRANLKTLVIGKDDGALTKADRIENYFGMAEPYPAASWWRIPKNRHAPLARS